jgi:putative capsular polysaccharide biosynthesis protein
MRRKKVLFIVGTLQSGGVSKSLVNLLNVWDSEKYETSLLLCCKEGDVFSEFIPPGVKVLYSAEVEHCMGGRRSVIWFIKKGHLIMATGVLLRLFLSIFSKASAGLLISRMMPQITEDEYDLIVDYGGQQILYYMVDKLKGKCKVSFFHNDYSKWPYYYKADRKYFPQVDRIFTISQVCVDALIQYFPSCKDKIGIMENISSPTLISSMAKELVELPDADNGTITIATLGHVCRRKGTDLSIEAAKLLKSRGIIFKWYLIGKVMESDLVDRIKSEGLMDSFVFLGIKKNPYPYIAAADLYVHPARYEGKSIALDEAKILCKPIVVTNFSTVNDQFTDTFNASICEMAGDSVAAKIIELIEDNELRSRYVTNLKESMEDNTSEVNKLYSLLGDNE